jgi:hypothetical protein
VSWADLFDDLSFSGKVGVVGVSVEDTLWGSFWTSFLVGDIQMGSFWS